MNPRNTVYYCYAVTRPFDPQRLEPMRGVEGAPVRAVEHAGLTALVSPVNAERFTEAALHQQLEDLDWLASVARAHNAVVDQATRTTTALPFRLATIYRDQQRVEEVLRSDEHRLTTALERLDGQVELGLKVFTVLSDPEAATAATTGETGRSYLKRRLDERDARSNSLQRAVESAGAVDAELSRLTGARHLHPAQNNELSGRTGQNVLNAAYLVAAEQCDGFAARVAELRRAHPSCRIDLTGPWAPYSFALDHIAPEETVAP